MDHHGHRHSHHGAEGNLLAALLINLLFSVIEAIGGLWTNSVAILSDALHDFGDALALAMALAMQRLARREGDRLFSYGYRRFSLLAALFNGLALIAGSALILIHTIPRLMAPEPVHTPGMMVLAVLGIVFNGVAALRLHRGHSLNERMAGWHMLEDVLSWSAVLISAVLMHFFTLPWLDAGLAIVFNLVILYGVGRLLVAAGRILLQGVPAALRVEAIESRILAEPEVQSVHGTHVWSLDGVYNVLTTHVVVASGSDFDAVCNLKARLRSELNAMDISHTTIEIERAGELCELDHVGRNATLNAKETP